MSAEVSLKEQLSLLRGMTIRTGVIHEAQALQLKMWPLLIPGVVSAEAHVDTERKIVVFECKSKGRKTKKVTLAFENIDSWVKQLLWPSTTVVVKMNGKLVYDSRNK